MAALSKQTRIFFILFGFLGLLFSGISGYYYFLYNKLSSEGQITNSIVVDYTYGRGQRSAPILEYLVNGNVYTHRHPTTIRGGETIFPLGSEHKIVYLPSDPSEAAMLGTIETQGLGYIFYGSMLFFILLPIAIFLYKYYLT